MIQLGVHITKINSFSWLLFFVLVLQQVTIYDLPFEKIIHFTVPTKIKHEPIFFTLLVIISPFT